MELSEGWRAVAADDELRRSYQAGEYDDAAWEPIAVPGHWRSTPAFADVDGPLLARCRFGAEAPAPGRRAWLTFEGLFYQGDVWLDGGYLGDTEGYFAPHTFEVTEALRLRPEHALAVEVTCSPERNPGAKRNLTGAFQAGLHADPHGNPGGIWRPVRVTETGPVRIAGLRALCRSADAERAVVALRATLDSDDARTVRVRTELGATDHELDQPLAAGANEVEWTVTVERPALWWPRALGDAALHDLRVTVAVRPDGDDAGDPTGGDGQAGGDGDDGPLVVSDERRLRTGLRSVRMRRWMLSVNGERLFVKGADVGPTRLALGEATPEEVRADVDHAVAAGLDLVRLHGHVGRPETYDAADEAGLLVWQDMPLRGPYARAVRRQAQAQAHALVTLLGHHPSIAVWCGHDEPVPLPADRAALLSQQLPSWNRTILDTGVKRALERADGTRPVVPHSGVLPHPPQLDGTDAHLYAGWHWGDERQLAALARAVPRVVRFVSEFGAQSVPDDGELARAVGADRWPDVDVEALTGRFGAEWERLVRYVPPAAHPTFAAWAEATRAYQATLVRRQVEALRRLKYRPTGGFAVAFLADARPAVSQGLLDHRRRPKPAWDAFVEACRPVIVVADPLPATVTPGEALALDVHVVSDRREPVEAARVEARLSWPGDEHRWRFGGEVPADAVTWVKTLPFVVPDRGPLVLDLALRLPGGEVVRNRYEAAVGAVPGA